MRGRHRVTGSTGGRKFVSPPKGCPSICHWDATTLYKKGDQVIGRDWAIYEYVSNTSHANIQPPQRHHIDGLKIVVDDPFPWPVNTGAKTITFTGTVMVSGTLRVNFSIPFAGTDVSVPVVKGETASAVCQKIVDKISSKGMYAAMFLKSISNNNGVLTLDTTAVGAPSRNQISGITVNPASLTAVAGATLDVKVWQPLSRSAHVLVEDEQSYSVGSTSIVKEFDVALEDGYLLKLETYIVTEYDNDSDYSTLVVEVDGKEVAHTATMALTSVYTSGANTIWTTQDVGPHHVKITVARTAGTIINDHTILATALPV